ncbi:MAG: hypothetical protein HOQ09_00985 [Gemmatimonadaceae bacterium]|nr:hypothetical protein [Gemmatimonadaceae bacterium]
MHMRVEWWHPHFANASGITAISGARFFSAILPVGERVAFAFEVPFARAKMPATATTPEYADASMGNWYLGLRFGDSLEPTAFVGEIGARLPATSDDAVLSTTVGTIADPERLEAFLPNSNSVSIAGNVVARREHDVGRLRLGVTQIFSNAYSGVGNHTLIDYGVSTSHEIERLRLAGALTGRLATTSDGPFGERSSHVATGAASIVLGAFRPSLSLRVPFEHGMRRLAPWTLGIGVEVSPRGKRC